MNEFRRLFLLGLVATALAPLQGKINSPFASPNSNQEKKQTTENRSLTEKYRRLHRLEFNGYMIVGGSASISLLDTETERAFWIPPGESKYGFEIRRFNPTTQSVVVSFDGPSVEISLKKPKIVSLQFASAEEAAKRDETVEDALGLDMAVVHGTRLERQRKARLRELDHLRRITARKALSKRE